MFGKETEQGKADKESIFFSPQKQNEESGIVNKGKMKKNWKRSEEGNRAERRVEENLEIVNKRGEEKKEKRGGSW